MELGEPVDLGAKVVLIAERVIEPLLGSQRSLPEKPLSIETLLKAQPEVAHLGLSGAEPGCDVGSSIDVSAHLDGVASLPRRF